MIQEINVRAGCMIHNQTCLILLYKRYGKIINIIFILFYNSFLCWFYRYFYFFSVKNKCFASVVRIISKGCQTLCSYINVDEAGMQAGAVDTDGCKRNRDFKDRSYFKQTFCICSDRQSNKAAGL